MEDADRFDLDLDLIRKVDADPFELELIRKGDAAQPAVTLKTSQGKADPFDLGLIHLGDADRFILELMGMQIFLN